MSLQHTGEHDAMKDNVVFSYEMNQACLRILPPSLPTTILFRIPVTKFFSIADISDRSIEPDVKDLSLCAFYRNWYTPIQIPGDSTRTQSSIQPTLTLTVDIGAPFLVLFQDPLLKPGLVLVKWEIPMLGGAPYQRMTCLSVIGIDEFLWRKSCSTFLTLVTISIMVMTSRTFTTDVAIRQKMIALFVIKLLCHKFHKFTLIV